MAKECFRCEYVRCGKARCKTCPHGPYWYGYWWEGKTRKRYIGKKDPRTPEDKPPADWREAINDRRTATPAVACRILGVLANATRDEVSAAFRRLMMQHHPDRGGDPKEAGYVSAAYSYLKAHYSW